MAELAQLFAHIDPSQRPSRDDGLAEAMRIAEALLFAAAEPLAEKDIEKRMPRGMAAGAVLDALKADYASRGVNLVRAGGKWMFRTAADLAWLLATGEGETKRLSRAALETLAIVAYHQPVTRAEIEDIRGVAISKGTLDLLLETGWVRLRGRRRAPGRPITYGTTEAFLIHFGLEAIGDLPGLEELKGRGPVRRPSAAGFWYPGALRRHRTCRGRGSARGRHGRRFCRRNSRGRPGKTSVARGSCARERSFARARGLRLLIAARAAR